MSTRWTWTRRALALGVALGLAAPSSACGSCPAMDAVGEGECDAFFGYVWDGDDCVGLGGCNCVGADCGNTYADRDACEAAHAGCL